MQHLHGFLNLLPLEVSHKMLSTLLTIKIFGLKGRVQVPNCLPDDPDVLLFSKYVHLQNSFNLLPAKASYKMRLAFLLLNYSVFEDRDQV